MNTLPKTTPRLFTSAILLALALNVRPSLAGQALPVHWGVPGQGLQLGIQFTKESFFAGEPVETRILTRNVTNTNVPSGAGTAYGLNGAFYDGYGIVVTQGTNVVPSRVNRVTDEWSPELGTGSAIYIEIAPGELREHTIRLDKEFDLKPEETYAVSASTRVRKQEGKGTAEIKTGKATVKIVPRPPASAQMNPSTAPHPSSKPPN